MNILMKLGGLSAEGASATLAAPAGGMPKVGAVGVVRSSTIWLAGLCMDEVALPMAAD